MPKTVINNLFVCYGVVMKIHRLDHVGIIVNHLPAAKEFFLDLGLIVRGEMGLESELLDAVTALKNVKTEMVMMQTPDDEATVELVKFVRPADKKAFNILQPTPPASDTSALRWKTLKPLSPS